MVSLLVGSVCVLSWCCWLIREGAVEEKEVVVVVEKKPVEEPWLVDVDVDEDCDEAPMQLLRELEQSLSQRVE
jgi:hypothetical protein